MNVLRGPADPRASPPARDSNRGPAAGGGDLRGAARAAGAPPARPECRSLGPLDVHVWTAAPAAIEAPELLAACEALESEDERARRLSLRFARDRLERLVSVALLRTSLSRYAAVEPQDWRFARGEQGRPELVPGQCEPSLRFNLSHAACLVACAVTIERDVGVDVEWTARRGALVEIAQRFFSATEVGDLQALPPTRRRERFFEYWTLKESYIKARGLGLRIPLSQFSFHLDAGSAPRISFDPRLGDDPAAWQFELHRPTPVHVLAVGARRAAGSDLNVSVRPARPLLEARPSGGLASRA